MGKRKEERAMGYGPNTPFTDVETWKLARKLMAEI